MARNKGVRAMLRVGRRRSYAGGRLGIYPVYWGDVYVGYLEKLKTTSTWLQPYRAFLCIKEFYGHAAEAECIGAFYPEDGGKKAALDNLLVARDRALEEGRIKEE